MNIREYHDRMDIPQKGDFIVNKASCMDGRIGLSNYEDVTIALAQRIIEEGFNLNERIFYESLFSEVWILSYFIEFSEMARGIMDSTD